MKIRRLKQTEMDKEKYDRCVFQSRFGTIYAMSWYLDVVSPNWELLSNEEYSIVMPLPVKQKWGIKFLIQPLFCQQLGIFSTHELTVEMIHQFIRAIPYSLYSMQLNAGNVCNYPHTQNNFVLDLAPSYAIIRKNYQKNFIRNIKKAEQANLQIENTTHWEEFLNILGNNTEGRPIHHILPFCEQTFLQLQQNALMEIWSVRNEQQAILSSVLFLQWKNRYYYMTPVSTSEGKQKQSMSFLLDKWIEKHANQGFILDFEGSSISNIARFYKTTGAFLECFPVLSHPAILFHGIARIKKIFK
jgi:hypothetical protein